MWRRWGALALLGLGVNLGLVACDGGGSDDKPAAPKVDAPALPRAAAFRVVYKVDDTAGPAPQVSTDVIQVALPWSGLLERKEGPPPGGTLLLSTVQNQNFTFNTAQGSTGFATRRIPGPLTTAPSPEALEAAAAAGLIDRGGEATVAGEPCIKWLYNAVNKPLTKPTAEEGVESCITKDGISLREAITLKGKLVRVAEATQVDRNPPVAPETFLTNRDPGAEGDKGLLETEQQITEERQSGKDIVKVTAPEGFKVTRQVKVLRQPGPDAPPISLYVQAFESGTDLVTTEQFTLGAPTWSADEGTPVELGGKRSGRVVYRTGWAEVRVTIDGKNVRVTSSRPAVALAVAKTLEL
jgi:hypothetical protein